MRRIALLLLLPLAAFFFNRLDRDLFLGFQKALELLKPGAQERGAFRLAFELLIGDLTPPESAGDASDHQQDYHADDNPDEAAHSYKPNPQIQRNSGCTQINGTGWRRPCCYARRGRLYHPPESSFICCGSWY